MAAYAALNSVMYIVQQIQHHPRPPITLEKHHMDSLCEIISFLQVFLEKHSHRRDIGDGKEALESRIADAAYAAEDVIESHIVDQIHEQNNFITLFCRGVKKMITTLACSCCHKTDQILTGDVERSSNSLFCQDLQKVIEDMNLIKKEAIEIQEKMKGIDDDQLPRNNIPTSANVIGSSTVPRPSWKNTNTMVGFDDILIEIMDRLTGYPTNRQVLPIVGMGGIGKTTLARNVYDHHYIMNQFDIRIWVTISQEYRLQDILLEALSCCQNDENKSSKDEVGVQLHKKLCGRRYLIVLDDMWSIEAWEELKLFFPDNSNGSRIMITTRLSNVSNHFGSCGFKMSLLDEDKSWDLFGKIVFPQDQFCPPELEEIGKKIARNCEGLPLSIAVIGGLLAKSEMTQQHWEYIAENLNSIVNLEDEKHCLNILYLSYNHLPIHLKPCFLYMGVFPEDSIISVPRLKTLWAAEGFLKPIAAKSLEEVAEEYLKDLIDRNLILVLKYGSIGKVKYCKIHDLLRDLCLREGQKDKFLWVSKVHDFDNLVGIESQRRISLHTVLEAVPLPSLARSLSCDREYARLLSQSHSLVRVINLTRECLLFDEELMFKNIFKFVNSRYLDFTNELKLTPIFPRSMRHLWNIQTLFINVGDSINLVPPEIWEMSQLRHLEICPWFSLPDPPEVPLIHEGDDDGLVLRNLQTLKTVRNLKLSEKVFKRIPNIKTLKLSYGDKGRGHNYSLNNLCLPNTLESLYIGRFFRTYTEGCIPREIDCFYLLHIESYFRIQFLHNFAFSNSLKKLTLHYTELLCEDMRMIGSLPHLQVLRLKSTSFKGSEWNPVEEEFLCLKFLLIDWCDDLVHWNANSTHFPCLEKLVLRHLSNLKEIPMDFGQISTLGYIELFRCSDSLVMSAKKLLDEQVEIGNTEFLVLIDE